MDKQVFDWLTDSSLRATDRDYCSLQNLKISCCRHLAVDGQWNVETVFAFQET